MTYQRKLEEARRLRAALAAGEGVDPADYPMLAATVGLDGETLGDVTGLIVAMDAAWARIGAAIEHARMIAKAAIDAAPDVEAARAVTPAWPEPPQ